MPLVYRTAGAWGAGKGANLAAAEVDANFWFLYQLILTVQAAQPAPDEITNITKSGNTITIYMASGATWGPFTLPTAVAETSYDEIDTASHTLALTDVGKFYDVNVACIVNIPTFASVPFPRDTEIHFRLNKANAYLYFDAAAGVVIKGMEGYDAGHTLRGGVVTLKNIGVNQWVLWGYLDIGGTGTFGTGTGV